MSRFAFLLSRAMLSANFFSQYSVLCLGRYSFLRPCQNTPWTSTASFSLVNAMSTLGGLGLPSTTAWWILNLNPSLWSSRRRVTSGFVFFDGLAFPIAVAAAFFGA